MIIERLAELGYTYDPAPESPQKIHPAVQANGFVFTSGQVPRLGDIEIKGKVGRDVDLLTAQKAARICAFNCLRAVGTVADIESVSRVVKLLGMVNVADGFSETSAVINGATEFLLEVFGENGYHARSAVGMVLPQNWSVEIEMIVQLS